MDRTPTSTVRSPWAPGVVAAMALLGAMVFIVSLGYGAGLPLIQPYLAQHLGPDAPQRLAWHVGMLGGVYTFALFLFAPWWGRLSDRHGRPMVLMAGFAAFLVGSAAAALAPNLGAVYVASALALTFTAVVSGAGALGLLIAVVGTGVGLFGPPDDGCRDRASPTTRNVPAHRILGACNPPLVHRAAVARAARVASRGAAQTLGSRRDHDPRVRAAQGPV